MNEEDLKEFQEQRKKYKNTKGKRLAYKINALILLYQGYSYQEIEDNQLLCERTVKFIVFPSYSPNLNPIGRLWKFFKKKGLSNQYDKNYATLKTAVMHFFEITAGKFKAESRTLLTGNFLLTDSI